MEASRWNERYQNGDIPWDVGSVTPALSAWVKEHPVKGKRIMVPGCGRGHDAHFLSKAGATVVGLDYAADALDHARAAYPKSSVKWLQADVTTMRFDKGFDLIWEYTCFCALLPTLRESYFERLRAALASGGCYMGLVFTKVVHDREGEPPFFCEPEDFEGLLGRHFDRFEVTHATEKSLKERYPNETWFQAWVN